MKSLRFLAVAIGAIVLSTPLPAHAQNLPLRNWTAAANSDLGHSSPFQTITPCRLVDTRYGVGGPATQFAANETRMYTIPASTACTGIPVAEGYSLSFTVLGYSGSGWITAWPSGLAKPTVSTVNFGNGAPVANAAVVAGNLVTGAISVYSSGITHLIIDINGYYTNEITSKQYYIMSQTDGDGSIKALNTSTTAWSAGVRGIAFGAGAGLYGQSLSGDASGFGVFGRHDHGGIGVYGWATNGGWAVAGLTDTGRGISGTASSAGGIAVFAVLNTSTPVAGDRALRAETAAQSNTVRVHAIEGYLGSTNTNSAAVFGTDVSGSPGPLSATASAIRGDSISAIGVLGNSRSVGVLGRHFDSNGVLTAWGDIGMDNYGVYCGGDFAVTGTKNFIEPHPTDATQVIRYVALEGPESGTYFRGRARFVNHRASIGVPESFRMVTDTEGLTVNVTPIGGLATVAVMSISLETIEVLSTNDVEFSYVVYGVRKAYRDHAAIAPGEEFVPEGPDARLPTYLSAEARARLISNGTYNADGTVNLSTAERLGWATKWRDAKAASTSGGTQY